MIFFFLHKKKLFKYAYNELKKINGLKFIGSPKNQSEILSFTIDGIHSHDMGTIANYYGVCIRTGHHCCMPVMNFYNISSTIRMSLSFYNVKDDIDKLIYSISKAKKIFS